MRLIVLLLKTLFPAICAVVAFGLITWQLRALDRYIPLVLPAWLIVVGIVLMIAGGALAFACFALFAVGGALKPGATFPDPVVFVSIGPYRYARNPMAAGALLALGGWGCVERSVSILLFTLVMAALMHAFVVFVEEPKLERRFGRSYLLYKSQVWRWLPSTPRGGRFT
jgi:protein-S-isoprenylcysteine O-methyltransferase Ste14